MIQQRGLELEISKGQKETMHFHPEVEVIFVIEGKLRAKIKDFKYELKKDAIILFNSNIKHSIECGDETKRRIHDKGMDGIYQARSDRGRGSDCVYHGYRRSLS